MFRMLVGGYHRRPIAQLPTRTRCPQDQRHPRLALPHRPAGGEPEADDDRLGRRAAPQRRLRVGQPVAMQLFRSQAPYLVCSYSQSFQLATIRQTPPRT